MNIDTFNLSIAAIIIGYVIYVWVKHYGEIMYQRGRNDEFIDSFTKKPKS